MTLALLALIAGVVLTGGLVLLFAALTGRITASPSTSGTNPLQARLGRVWEGPYRNVHARKRHQRLLLAGLAAAVVVWLYSGVPGFAVVVALAVQGLPWLLGAGAIEQEAIIRLQAIESWTRRLRDLVARGMGLQQAMVASLANAPAEIHTHVRNLALNLQAGTDLTDALYQFAGALDDPHADEVIASLIQQAALRGDSLGEQLSQAANDAAAEAAQRQEAHAERASGRMTLTVLTIALCALFGAGVLMPAYVAPFRSGLGQVVLAIGVSICIGVLLAARSVSMPRRCDRILRRRPTAAADTVAVAQTVAKTRPVMAGAHR